MMNVLLKEVAVGEVRTAPAPPPMRARLGALLVAILVGVGLIGLSASPASAAVRYCGITTCTDYSSRTEVRNSAAALRAVESQVGNIWNVTCGGMSVAAGAVGAAITGPLGLVAAPVVWIGCEAMRYKYGSIADTIKAAAANGQCVGMSFARYGSNNPLFATGWWRYNCNWG